MGSKESKQHQNFNPQETAEFLRNLAQAVENKQLTFNGKALDWQDVHKLEFTFIPQGEQILLKSKLEEFSSKHSKAQKEHKPKATKKQFKTGPRAKRSSLKKRILSSFQGIWDTPTEQQKHPVQEAPAEQVHPRKSRSQGKEGYKRLKKRMKQTFTTIFRQAHNYQLPPEKEIQSFVRDSEAMVQFPGYGDEYYNQYLEKVREMHQAHQNQDIHSLLQTIQDLNQLQMNCHKRHK